MVCSLAPKILLSCLVAGLVFFSEALAATPPAPGYKISKGHIPTQCSDSDVSQGASVYGTNYGYYYSSKSKAWVQNAWCYPVWGNLKASEPQLVTAGEAITIYATPTGGSNSAEYAPQTRSISWQYTGKLVSGCGSSDLACTFIPFKKKQKEWQWTDVYVTMPRTFFIDHPGSNCAGQHICAGFSTKAWTFVGTPPCGTPSSKTVEVAMLNKTFIPSSVLVDPGTTVRMCNQDPFPQKPYAPDNSKFGNKTLNTGECINFKVPKTPVSKRANTLIYDALHTKMRLKIVIVPNKC